jgi:hypothetical protein
MLLTCPHCKGLIFFQVPERVGVYWLIISNALDLATYDVVVASFDDDDVAVVATGYFGCRY